MKRQKNVLILTFLLLFIGTLIFYSDKSNLYKEIYPNYIFTLPQIEKMCKELDSIGVRYEILEGNTALAIHTKDRSRALLHLASRKLPRNPGTLEQHYKERFGDDSWGDRPFIPEIPRTFIYDASRQKFSEYNEDKNDHSIKAIVNKVPQFLNCCGCQRGKIIRDGIDTPEDRTRLYYRNVMADIKEIISSVDGVEDAEIKFFPKPGLWFGKRCSSCVKLTMKPGFTLNKSQVETIEYLIKVSVEESRVDGIGIFDETFKRLNMESDICKNNIISVLPDK